MSDSKDDTVSFATVRPVQAIRSAFPALERKMDDRPVAFFDGPGGTQVPGVVVDAMSDYLLHHNANTHWLYPTSVETDQALASARRALADFVNGSPGEIAFGANMTTLTFHLSRALGRSWGPGDEVLVTELDHHANIDTWRGPWARSSSSTPSTTPPTCWSTSRPWAATSWPARPTSSTDLTSACSGDAGS